MNPYKDQDLRKFLESIPEEEIERQNRLQEERNETMWKDFVEHMNKGVCFMCGQSNDSFVPEKFCFHWFLYPLGIKKKYFSKHLHSQISFFRLDAYFRWVASYENPVVNINNLTDEKSRSSYIETTIRYKNIEWAFSVGHTDKDGHKHSSVGNRPHFHLQMKVDDKIFLKFNDFHIEFTDEDLFMLALLEQAGDKLYVQAHRGEGISILEHEEILPDLVDGMTIAEDEATAPFRIQTFIEAPEGQTISGALIAKAAEESAKTKEPAGQILKRLLPNAKFTTIVLPGDGVPEMTKRSGKK